MRAISAPFSHSRALEGIAEKYRLTYPHLEITDLRRSVD